jgi:hypothetical protein
MTLNTSNLVRPRSERWFRNSRRRFLGKRYEKAQDCVGAAQGLLQATAQRAATMPFFTRITPRSAGQVSNA